MSEHTKGPWSVGPDSLMVRARGCTIAEVIPQHNARANAELIAAAPTMLSALEAVRDLMAPESGIYIGTAGSSAEESKEAQERIDRTFQLVAHALHAAKGQQDTAPDEPSTPR